MKIEVTKYVLKNVTIDVEFPVFTYDADSTDDNWYETVGAFTLEGPFLVVTCRGGFLPGSEEEASISSGYDATHRERLLEAVTGGRIVTKSEFEKVRARAREILDRIP